MPFVSMPKLSSATLFIISIYCSSHGTVAAERYFSAGVLHARWLPIVVEGFSKPITGIVYRGLPRPTCGMPLGGLDTGCVDIETNGMLGYDTRLNHLVDPRLLHNEPFVGLSCDSETVVLVSDKNGKQHRPVDRVTGVFPPLDYSPLFFDVGLDGVKLAKSIDYYGHYPIVDMEYETDLPVSIGLRAWSPFLPGDKVSSMAPGIVMEFSLRNLSDDKQNCTLAINLPEYPISEGINVRRNKIQENNLTGIEVTTDDDSGPNQMGLVVAVLDEQKVRSGGHLGNNGSAWNQIARDLPETSDKSLGSSIAVDIELDPQQDKVVRFVWTWHAPSWNASGGPLKSSPRAFKHMYAKYYSSALDVARKLGADHDAILKKIIAWQEAIHGDKSLPGWLADSLINNLHLITETSIWGQSEGPLSVFPKEGGLFALNECPRGCPQLECIPCSFYGNMPIVYFFPEAALSTLRGYKQFQFADGRPPWIFGGITASEKSNQAPYDLCAPDKGYQSVLNAASYIVMVDRYWRTSDDNNVLKEFYDSLKRANDFSLNLRPKYGDSQIVAMPEPGTDGGGLGDTEWFEAPEPGWKGYVTHAGGVRMAQVQIMKRMAEAMGDQEYAKRCEKWLQAGSQALEQKLWNGNYYLNFYEPESDLKSDLIFGYQLDGEWICDSHGVASVFPKNRIDATLETIRSANCALSQSGATNYANPDGTPAKVGGYGTYGYFPPELMMLAMTYMYEGQKEFGLDLLRRCQENVVCNWGYTWDAPNTIRGDMDTGQRHFGADYYQNMMLWLVPVAINNTDFTGSMGEQGIVQRVIHAANFSSD